jgi:secreted PhoX family phosphatase
MKMSSIVSSLIISSLFALSGCYDNNENTKPIITDVNTTILPSALSLSFAPVAVPSVATQNLLSTTASVSVSGQSAAINYSEIIKTGYADNGEVFGAVKDVDGNQIRFSDASLYLCNGTNNGSGSGLDFSSILQQDGKLFLVSQFECSIGAMYMMELDQSATGAITPKANTLKYIPQGEHGGWTHCAGSISPWNSHLGSEEYETNARSIELKGNMSDSYFKELQYFWGDKFASASPYFYGWITETKIDTATPTYVKHYSMGRFSHEMAYVMPDEKTVYMSDDGANTGFFMFIADTAGNLSSGTLYAAKFNQTANFKGGAFDLTWIDLGHSSDADMKIVVDSAPKFSDIFDAAAPLCGTTCEEGFTSVNTSAGQECLKVKEGKEEIASRLETRRYAAIKGATTEINKEEGIDYDPVHNKLYIAISSISDAMEDNNAKDFGGYNHIRLPKNSAGAVYALDLAQDDTLDSRYIAKNFHAIIFGENKDYTATEFVGNKDDVNKISNPDNLTYIANSNTLIIAEDSGAHINNMMWAYDVDTAQLTRIAALPKGAEATSTVFYRNINGFSYLSLVTQHPIADKESAYGLFTISSNLKDALSLPTTKESCEASSMTWNGTLCFSPLAPIDYTVAASNDVVKAASGSCYTTGDGVVFGSNFECKLTQPWLVYSAASNADWVIASYGSDTYAYISGYGADAPSKDWLISPKLILTGDEVLNFRSAKGYNGSDIVVKISTNYIGSGDPLNATWTDLNATIATTANGNYVWTNSGNVSLKGLTGDAYLAFYHEAPGTVSNQVANWEVDDIVISGSGSVFVPFQAAFTLSKSTVLTDQYIEFKSSISGGEAPYKLSWDMGNGITKTDSNFCYKYPSEGNFTVAFNVTDIKNETATQSKNVIVNKPLDEKVPTKIGDLRIATYNAYLNRFTLGDLHQDLLSGSDQQIKNVANIIQQVNPDVILINEFDYNGTANVDLLKSKYLKVSQGLGDSVDYPYYFVAESNTGIQTGLDYNRDGKTTGDDAFGFGDFAGQYAMVVLSKHPIDTANVKTFQKFLWKDMPNAYIPKKADGSNYFSDAVMAQYRLSSKSHWDVPVNVGGKIFHVLASHPTPPTFDDGDKDGKTGGADNSAIVDWNGLRNHDEIRLWADYIKGENYLYDDNKVNTPFVANTRFVIMGDENADANEGDSYKNAIMQLLNSPFINATVTPISKGATSEGVASRDDDDTANWSMHADYVLPSRFGFDINQCGVYWPELNDKKHYLVEKNPDGTESSSDHRLVWCDLNFIDKNTTQVPETNTSAETNTTSTGATNLYFSEYVEGSASNKAVEIYNGSDKSVTLSDYKLAIYGNGSATATIERALDAVTLEAGMTFVMTEPNAGDTLKAKADFIASDYLGYNGDDAVALIYTPTGEIVDVIGQIGTDPGTTWGTGDITTTDHTLRRKATVTTGDTDGSNAFDPAIEWDTFTQDTFDGLDAR